MIGIAGIATQAQQSFRDGAGKCERAGSDADPRFLSAWATHVATHMSARATHRASAHELIHRPHRRTAVSPAAERPEAPAAPEEAAGGKQNQCKNDNAQHIEPLLSSGHVSSLLTIIIIHKILKSSLKNSCFIQNNLLRAFPRAGIQEVSNRYPDLPYFIYDGVILPVGDGVALDRYHVSVPDDGSVDDGLILIHGANIAGRSLACLISFFKEELNDILVRLYTLRIFGMQHVEYVIQLSSCAGIFPVLVRNAVTQHELVHPARVSMQQGI